MRRLVPLAAALVALIAAGNGSAGTVVLRDAQGRPITFDVQTQDVDVEWYGDILRRAAHGNEISRVTIRLVSVAQLRRACGQGVGGCYRFRRPRALIVVPALMGTPVAHALLHEYAHHLDRWRGVRGVPEPNGTAHWWKQRGMASLLRAHRVAFDYSRGWDRGISEIFAEDYVQLHLRVPYKIGWLSRPTRALRAALKRDIPGVPNASAPPPPFTVVRRGTLEPGKSRSLPFGLLGRGRRVTFTVEVPADTAGAGARLTLRCGRRTVTRDLLTGESAATIDQRGLGPARGCSAALSNTSLVALQYTLRLRLAVER